jgi:23S rRNA (pseudouridine1915-N3)-methyltransferase
VVGGSTGCAKRLKLHIFAVGKIGRCPEAELVSRYIERIAWPTQITELSEHKPVLPVAAGQCRTVVMDERGKAMGSQHFAALLDGWRNDAVRETRFFIGGADGHDEAVRASADLLLSFGPATWPHMLARAMLAEQLFRAVSILANHPYHRA